jgi:hypothetical protein
VFIGVDHPWSWMILSAQSLTQKTRRAGGIACGGEQEVDRVPVGIDCPVQVDPFAFSTHIGFIHPLTIVGGFEPRAQTPLHFWTVTLYPSPYGDMIGKKAALGQELFHIPVGERKAQVPSHSQQNDFRFKLTPLEQVTYRRAGYHIGRFIRPFLQTCNTTSLVVIAGPGVALDPPGVLHNPFPRFLCVPFLF